MCLYPKLIKNKRYEANKKNGGNIPPILDERTIYVPIACGYCMECRKQKSREWQIRLREEVKHNKTGKFITLTFNTKSLIDLKIYINEKEENPKGYALDNAIAKTAMRLFLERWRKRYKKSLRHWFITELGHGNTEHMHLHGIVWTNEDLNILEKIWQYGYVWKGRKEYGKVVNYVNNETVSYVTKYMTKVDRVHNQYKPKILCSPGIGNQYTLQTLGNWIKNKFKDTETKETYTTESGHEISLPIYYRNKIYSEENREQLWLNKLDKNERWVLGTRVDISKNLNAYNRLLKQAQETNIKLGYGKRMTWEEEDYKNQLRELKLKERINPKALELKKLEKEEEIDNSGAELYIEI